MYLISACLAGINCRYDGKNSENELIMKLVKEEKAILVCPEELGGLPTPRPSCEIVADRDGIKKVKTKSSEDKTKEFLKGAEEALKLAKEHNIKTAILKAKSPSCGVNKIYDGSFSGKLIEGNGLTADLLIKNGIEVITEVDLCSRFDIK
jgi:uncharacterized protein YbbK (DUF523 family)